MRSAFQRGFGWSFPIGRVFGIQLRMHVTFLLFVAWIALSQGGLSGDVRGALSGVGLMLMVFACVLLHELGHALAARRYGIQTRDIVLLPIGGLARLERMPERPSQELVVALAGPAVNVVIAAVTFGLGMVAGDRVPAVSLDGDLVTTLFAVNVVMLAFNLIPAFPMDGGRVLRALLAMRMPYDRATRAATIVGQVVAVGFALAGIFTSAHTLLLIALFVFFAAAEERASVTARAAITALTVRDAMRTDVRALDVNEPLQTALDQTRAGVATDFVVVEDGRAVGVLPYADLVASIPRGAPDRRVGDVFRRTDLAADAAEPLMRAVARMHAATLGALPVVDQGRIAGLLTVAGISERLNAHPAR